MEKEKLIKELYLVLNIDLLIGCIKLMQDQGTKVDKNEVQEDENDMENILK